MSALHVLIVEDDPSFALELEMMLREMGYESIAKATTLLAAQQALKRQRPDLVISDIFLSNEKEGIIFARELLLIQIPVILITSSQEQATYNEARAALPAAYLVKPFDRLSLQAAIERTFVQQGNPVFLSQILQKWHRTQFIKDHIFVRKSGALVKLTVEHIDHVEADGNYCYLFERGKKFAVKSSLKAIKSLLSGGPFLQVNRSTLINFNQIREVNFSDNLVVMNDGETVIGNTYRKEIEGWMNRL